MHDRPPFVFTARNRSDTLQPLTEYSHLNKRSWNISNDGPSHWSGNIPLSEYSGGFTEYSFENCEIFRTRIIRVPIWNVRNIPKGTLVLTQKRLSRQGRLEKIRGRVPGAGHSFFCFDLRSKYHASDDRFATSLASRAKNSIRVFWSLRSNCLQPKLRTHGRNKALRASTLLEADRVTRIMTKSAPISQIDLTPPYRCDWQFDVVKLIGSPALCRPKLPDRTRRNAVVYKHNRNDDVTNNMRPRGLGV